MKEFLVKTKVDKPKVEIKEKSELKEKFDFKQFFSKNKSLILLIFSSATISILAIVYLYFFVIKLPTPPAQVVNSNGLYIESSFLSANKIVKNISQPTIPKTEVNPLNGSLFTKTEMAKMLKRRPVAVIINNHTSGRPQSGLNDADIIYEAVTESGITRYMPIYWSDSTNKVGPIRSARQYFLEWLSPFDALFIHDGCASTNDPRTNACGNIYTYKIKNVSTFGAWRVNDRVSPHNEYSSVLTAWELGKDNDWDDFPNKTESLLFKRDAKFDDRGDKTRVKIRHRTDMPNYGLYDSEWVYNKNTNMYTHKIGGQTDIDNETKKPITAKTVIIEEVALIDAYDGKGRVIITTIGKGKAKILMDGKIISGKWEKKNRTDRTRYYDNAGKEFEINRGRIWICALSNSKGKFDIIEQ